MASIHKKTWETKKKKKHGVGVSWIVRWRDESGRERSKSCKTHDEAKEKRAEIESRQRAGQRTQVVDRSSLAAFLSGGEESYIERAHTIGIDGEEPVGAARRDQLRWCAGRIDGEIGDLQLEHITEDVVRRFRDRMLRSGLERKSAKEILGVLKAALEDARRQGLVLDTGWRDVKIVSTRSKRRRADDDGDDELEMPSREQARLLLKTAKALRDDTARAMGWEPDQQAGWRQYTPSEGPRGWKDTQRAWRRNYVIVLLALLTGMRQGEIRALRKRDVDFARGVINVRRAADVDNTVKEPKTRAGVREIPVPAELAEELQAWLEIAPAGQLVFPSAKGGIMDRSNFYHRIWRQLLRYAGMADCGLSFHSLRHYYASSIIAAGMNPKEVKETMGHSSIQITFDLYGHLFESDISHRQAAVARSTEALFGA